MTFSPFYNAYAKAKISNYLSTCMLILAIGLDYFYNINALKTVKL